MSHGMGFVPSHDILASFHYDNNCPSISTSRYRAFPEHNDIDFFKKSI